MPVFFLQNDLQFFDACTQRAPVMSHALNEPGNAIWETVL